MKIITTYYIYQNWVAHHNSGKIHISSCSFCKNGQGRDLTETEKEVGKSGVWIGPFSSFELANEYLEKFNFIETSNCENCIN